jgi:outer membrane protein, multidrug efflux system
MDAIDRRLVHRRPGSACIVRRSDVATVIAMIAWVVLHDSIALAQPFSPAKPSSLTAQPPSPAQVRLRERENELLSAPLSQDNAAEIAFLHSPTVTRGLAMLGIDEAMRLGVAHGPARVRAREALDVESRIERPLTVNVLGWLTEAVLARDPALASAHVRARAAEDIGVALFTARRAWISAVTALQEAALLERMLAASQASHELAQRMQRIGNASSLEALRAERSLADAVGRHMAARAIAAIEREQLAHTLGLWGQDIERIQLPSRLSDLPASVVGAEGLEARAVAQRWDLRRLRAAIDAEDANATVGAPPSNIPSSAHEADHGPLRAQLDEAAVRARAEVRAAWMGYRAGFDLARHARDVMMPVVRRISEETLLRYNGMLVSVFALLADTAEQANVASHALHAERNFWLAEVDLQQALAGIGIVNPGAHLPGRMRGTAMESHHAAH